MFIDCKNAQYISSNITELCELITTFKEINEGYSNFLILSLYNDTWEVHDMRANKVLFEYPFKRYKDLTASLRKLGQAINIVGAFGCTLKKPNPTINYAVKFIISTYGFDDYFFNNPKLISYVIRLKQEKDNY